MYFKILHLRFDIQKINDFSTSSESLNGTDYMKAFGKTEELNIDINERPQTLEDLIKLRSSLY